MSKPTVTQRKILENADAGRKLDYGRAFTQSAAAGWGCSILSCRRRWWIDGEQLTPKGRAVLRLCQRLERAGREHETKLAALRAGTAP